jgi:hypothetical protein
MAQIDCAPTLAGDTGRERTIVRKHSHNGTRQPLSGDVWQAINPWSWWLESTGQQVGFINIYRTEAGDTEQELEIVENVASYGKQLGRIIDALSVVLQHESFSDLEPDEELAKRRFLEMADEISAVKGNFTAPSAESVDRLLVGMSRIRQQDPESYRMLRARLLEGLKSETDLG